jgi:hypothetical protein
VRIRVCRERSTAVYSLLHFAHPRTEPPRIPRHYEDGNPQRLGPRLSCLYDPKRLRRLDEEDASDYPCQESTKSAKE